MTLSGLPIEMNSRSSNNKKIIGHEDQLTLLKKQIDQGNLKPVWLFEGKKGIGKATCAYHLARYIFKKDAIEFGLREDCIDSQVSQHSYPNLKVVTLQNEETSIGVEQVRTFLTDLSLRPSLPGLRLIIIDALDDMTFQSQNCLLKTLEDTPDRTVFFLLNHKPERVILTVRSRANRLVFKGLEGQAENYNELENNLIWQFCQGSLGQYIALKQWDIQKKLYYVLEIFEQVSKNNVSAFPLRIFQNEVLEGETFLNFWTWLMGCFVNHLHSPHQDIIEGQENIFKRLAPLKNLEAWVKCYENMNRFYLRTEGAHLKCDDRLGAMLLILAGQQYEE